jgi:aminopeptidase S
LATTGVQAETIEFEGDSDFEAFIGAGIPSGGLATTGDEEQKTAEQAAKWGGQAGEEFDSCYHTACDRIDHLDPVALDRHTRAVAGTVIRFAESNETLTR